jgi:hypothetical protein
MISSPPPIPKEQLSLLASFAALSSDGKMDVLRLLVEDVLAHQGTPGVLVLSPNDGEPVAYIVPAVLRPMVEVDLSAGLAELEDPDGHVPVDDVLGEGHSSDIVK